MAAKPVLVFSDRYSVMGPPNGCKGLCEGTGWIPVKLRDTMDPRLRKLWEMAEAEKHSPDGWHFVRCPDCHPQKKSS